MLFPPSGGISTSKAANSWKAAQKWCLPDSPESCCSKLGAQTPGSTGQVIPTAGRIAVLRLQLLPGSWEAASESQVQAENE